MNANLLRLAREMLNHLWQSTLVVLIATWLASMLRGQPAHARFSIDFRRRISRDARIGPALAAMAVVAIPIALGRQQAAPRVSQTASPLKFEVDSIKPASETADGVEGGCHGVDSKFAPGDPTANIPLERCVISAGRLSHLMRLAFQMSAEQISGYPDWDGPSRFDVEAKAENPATATEQQLLTMLQNLLVERFQLTLRHTTTEVPILALVAGKNAPRLHPSALEARSPIPEIQGADLVLKGYSMADLADFLSNLPSIGRPVRDRTGINGRFDFTFNLLEKPSESGGTVRDMKMAIAGWQTAVDVVQEQTGLKLESTKGPVASLVIVHAEKPSLN